MSGWYLFSTKPKANRTHPNHLKDGWSRGVAPFLFPRGGSRGRPRSSHQPAPEVPKGRATCSALNVQPGSASSGD